MTQSVIARGADVIFGMGDGASFGYLQAIETAKAGHKVWFIDVIGNKTAIDKKHVLLSSVIWDFTQVFKQAIRAIDNGTFGTKPYFLTVLEERPCQSPLRTRAAPGRPRPGSDPMRAASRRRSARTPSLA